MTFEDFNIVMKENMDLVDSCCSGMVHKLAQELFREAPHLLLMNYDLEFNRDICMANLLILMMLESNPKKILDIFIKHIKDCCAIEEDEDRAIIMWEGLHRSMKSISHGRIVNMMIQLSYKGNYEDFSYDKFDNCLDLIYEKANEILKQGIKIPNEYFNVWRDIWK